MESFGAGAEIKTLNLTRGSQMEQANLTVWVEKASKILNKLSR